MKIKEVLVLKEAVADLECGRIFYESNAQSIGNYFFDSLILDIESLKFYAGIHSKRCEMYRLLSKRFPFAVYYEIDENFVKVVAVLDLRRDPAWSYNQLKTRKNSQKKERK
ncbi:hypothetical protein MNBD_UNCLBAC01-1114 [hydrothermal vent metagenome]|uniref:Type II toxin-antitoxin system RelE/ParE family toxin n=1 Tax=hydrothermal vent metagenome TaxID=652676 RepID=A0A3B1DLU7_9ZZZZ